MIFETLNESSKNGELILVCGGLCHWHLRRDGQITIREILVLPEFQGLGIGLQMLNKLKRVKGAKSIFAKCPANLPSNGWYEHIGFELEGIETTKTERKLKLWRFQL